MHRVMMMSTVKELASLFTNVTHLEDMSLLLSNYWTTSLESFHNVVINFAPKAVAFSYKGMKTGDVLLERPCIK